MVTEQPVIRQLSLDRGLFLPNMTVQAMRDSRYRHAANAVAELIDNSIDANASTVEVLVKERSGLVRTRHRWYIDQLALFDDGYGMDAETLEQALRFGGRAGGGQLQRIGKYGMGLPTASVSQARRLEVWTWQGDSEKPLYSYIDVDEIEEGSQVEIPEAREAAFPSYWKRRISKGALDPDHGTLVVWSNVDRIKMQVSTLLNQLEREVGRIYRHFINEGTTSIRMATFRPNKTRPETDAAVSPNDPLYLIPNSSTPEPWGAEPMFKALNTETYTVDVGGREETVEVTYSIVKQDTLGTQAPTPGSLPHGQHARHNMGVSVVREGREIVLDESFVRSGGRGDIPMNRWWGCEIRFNQGCDDLFGIDHNKQMVVALSNAARDLLNSEEPTDALYEELGVDNDPVYRIVGEIRNTTRSLLDEVKIMFERRRRLQAGMKDDIGVEIKQTPTELEATELMTRAVIDSIERGNETPTQTDIDREKLDPNTRKEATLTYLTNEVGEDEAEASKEADDIVRSGIQFMFKSMNLDGYQMFNVRKPAGTLFVNLNINHDLYEFLNILNDNAVESDDPQVRRAAVGIRTLLLAWARMEDHIELTEDRQRVQAIAARWGQHAGEVLRRVNEI